MLFQCVAFWEAFGDCPGFWKPVGYYCRKWTHHHHCGILRTLLWLWWVCQFDTIPGNGHPGNGQHCQVAFWGIFCDCCGFEENLLNGRQLVLAAFSLLQACFLAFPRTYKTHDPCHQLPTFFFVCQWFRKWSLLHVSGSTKQLLKTLDSRISLEDSHCKSVMVIAGFWLWLVC